MYRLMLLVAVLLAVKLNVHGQIPVQLFGGTKALEYNFLWDRNLDKSGKLRFFNFTFFNVGYNNPGLNSFEIYQVATYNLTPQWGLAGGGRFTPSGFSPLLALSYQIESRDWYVNVFPTMQYLPAQRQWGYSMFVIAFYQPQINDTWGLFNQFTFEPLFVGGQHLYSYQQLRAGLSYKKLFEFGLGANLDQVGPQFIGNHNVGLFIRKEL